MEFYHNKYNTAIIKHSWNLMTKKSQILCTGIKIIVQGKLFCWAQHKYGGLNLNQDRRVVDRRPEAREVLALYSSMYSRSVKQQPFKRVEESV